MTNANKQKRVIAKIEALRKRAAAGDMKAKAELDRVAQIASRFAMAQRAQSVAIAHAIAEQQAVEQTEATTDLGYTSDTFDIADRIAASALYADTLDQKVAMRHAEWQRLNDQAPFVRAAPPSVLRGILGNQAEVVAGGPLKDVANWEGEDAETCEVTITLAPVIPPEIALPSPLWRPFARVFWGTKAMSAQAEVDVGLGTQFSLTASSVRVQVGLDEVPAGTAIKPLTMIGMISFGSVNRQVPLTRTIYMDLATAPPSLESFARVPAFAKALKVVRGGITGTYQFKLYFNAFNGTNVYQYEQAANTYMNDAQPLTPETAGVFIENMSGPGAANTCRLIFELSL
jgi:hypothetical protein